jgi:hypothetical protein
MVFIQLINATFFFRVQLGYATQLQGRLSESQTLYQKVLKQKPSDVAVCAIAANNSAVINGAQNVFDSRRKLKMTRTTMEENEAKFTNKQRQTLSINQCLFLGSTSQVKPSFKNCRLLHIYLIFLLGGPMQESYRTAYERLSRRFSRNASPPSILGFQE